MPFSSSFARTRRSISVLAQVVSLLCGIAGILRGWKDQNFRISAVICLPWMRTGAVLFGQGAPILTHSVKVATSSGESFPPFGIFSVPVSGYALKGWIDGTLSGPDWLSGGVFGAEASIVAVIVCVSLAIWLLRQAAQRDRFIAPRWRRVAISATPTPTITER